MCSGRGRGGVGSCGDGDGDGGSNGRGDGARRHLFERVSGVGGREGDKECIRAELDPFIIFGLQSGSIRDPISANSRL